MLTQQQITQLQSELTFQTSRSGGKGGQNVNKVESKVELGFNVKNSEALTTVQKTIIAEKLQGTDTIKIVSSRHRSQLQNKEECVKKLLTLLNKFLKPVKKRKATKPSRAAKENKLKSKKKQGEKKQLRKKVM